MTPKAGQINLSIYYNDNDRHQADKLLAIQSKI